MAARSGKMTNQVVRVLSVLSLWSAFLVGPLAPEAAANPTAFTVNSTADQVDGGPGDGVCDTGDDIGNPPVAECTLRAAVQEANSSAGAQTIDLPAGEYLLDLEAVESAGGPTAATGDLDLTDDVTISGASRDTTVIRPRDIGGTQVGSISRVFETWGGETEVLVQKLELLKGNAHSESAADGGGIRNNQATLSLVNVAVTDGGACNGGGVSNHNGSLTLTNAVFRLNDSYSPAVGGCSSTNGAAVYADGGETAIDSSVISENDSEGDGAALYLASGTADVTTSELYTNSALGSGGGVAVAGGTMTVAGSTFFDNIAENNGGAAYHGAGQLTVSNSTITENGAGTSEIQGAGGALFTRATTTLSNVTVAFNVSTGPIGGLAQADAGVITMRNTILAGSDGLGVGGAECNAVLSEAGNIIENVQNCTVTGDPSTYDIADPHLGSLADNGGPTETVRPDDQSIAFDGGDNTSCLATDQRGVARPSDGPDAGTTATCDVGSYEFFDTDGDGLEDHDENNIYFTDPALVDTDEDLLGDGAEVNDGYDPRDPCDPSSDNEACLASIDTDGDGLTDNFDSCDGQVEDMDGFQDNDGCPEPDNDGDTILDVNDQCPNGAEDADGFQDGDGCPEPDNDSDGINDNIDLCDNVAEDGDGFQDSDGCPDPDNDSDGVNDVTDNCDNVAEDADGFQDSDGCPDPDNDGDGVLDGSDPAPNNSCVPDSSGGTCDSDGDGLNNAADNCDNVAEDADGFQDSDGCPDPDNDSDGVNDVNDNCDNVAEDADGFQDSDGCPDPDNDSDGVLDGSDPAPNNSCVPNATGGTCDPDGDGINNSADACDNQAEDTDGFQDSDGCPEPDNDSDGINDGSDGCANQAEDADGFEDSDGCPEAGPDQDSDGVDDGFDNCDDQAEDTDGYQDGDGCPDPDNDSDGVLDGVDGAPNDPCLPSNEAGVCDRDGDTKVNAEDNCDTAPNATQSDADGDGVGDLCDTPHRRTITNLKLRKHVVFSGTLTVSDSATNCVSGAGVVLQLKKTVKGKLVWSTVAQAKTTGAGTFTLVYKKDARGSYRVVASKFNVTYGGLATACSAATSKTLTHKH